MSAAITYGLIQGGIYAGGALAKWWAKRKALSQEKGFGGSAYERELKRRTKEGIYSPGAKSTMLGQVSRRAGQTAQLGKSRVGGYMESRGLGRSMIGQSTMKDYDTDVMNRIAETTREIELANEASKVQAKERYAMERYKDRIRKGQIEGEKTVALGELVSGGVGALGTGIQAGRQYGEENRTIADMFGGVEKVPKELKDFASLPSKHIQGIQSLVGYGGIGGKGGVDLMEIYGDYKKDKDVNKFYLRLIQEGLDSESAKAIMKYLSEQGTPSSIKGKIYEGQDWSNV